MGVGRSREEQEHRWRQWQQRKRNSEKGGCAGTTRSKASGVTDTSQTIISEMPAGQRASKCMGNIYAGNVRLPLFGEDCPKPAWTTLSSAPWVDRPNSRPRAPTAPWIHDEQEQEPLSRELPRLTRDTDTAVLSSGLAGLPQMQPAAPSEDSFSLAPKHVQWAL